MPCNAVAEAAIIGISWLVPLSLSLLLSLLAFLGPPLHVFNSFFLVFLFFTNRLILSLTKSFFHLFFYSFFLSLVFFLNSSSLLRFFLCLFVSIFFLLHDYLLAFSSSTFFSIFSSKLF